MADFKRCKRCNQQACLASGEKQLCGVHWRAHVEEEEAREAAQSLSDQISEAETFEDLREIVREIAERAGLLD